MFRRSCPIVKFEISTTRRDLSYTFFVLASWGDHKLLRLSFCRPEQ